MTYRLVARCLNQLSHHVHLNFLKWIVFVFLVENGHRYSFTVVCVIAAGYTYAILRWRDSNISDWHFYCFSDEDCSEGTTRSEFTVEVLHWWYSAQYRWQLPTAFRGEDTLNMQMAVNRHAAWCGDQPPDLRIWLLVRNIQCNSNILRNAACHCREVACSWKSFVCRTHCSYCSYSQRTFISLVSFLLEVINCCYWQK